MEIFAFYDLVFEDSIEFLRNSLLAFQAPYVHGNCAYEAVTQGNRAFLNHRE